MVYFLSMQKRLFFILGILILCITLLIYLQRQEIQTIYHKFFVSTVLETQDDNTPQPESKVKIAFLDIGQGDASFVQWPDGTQMLIDCAIDDRILEALGRVMSPFDHTLDYLVVSHPDLDHYGGCVDVMKRFEVKHIVYNGYKKNSSQYFPVFLQTIQDEVKAGAEYIEMDHEQTWNINSSTLHFLYPDLPINTHPFLSKIKKTDVSNNTSILMILQYGNKKVMFTGDTEFDEENYLLSKYLTSTLDVDVLKVGHHGSSGSTSDAFLRVLTPEYAMISSGAQNRYGHPTLRTLHRLERASAQIWRTDQNGDILMDVYEDKIDIENQ